MNEFFIQTSKPVMAIWCMESLTDLMISNMVAKASSSSAMPSLLLHFNISWETGRRKRVRKIEQGRIKEENTCEAPGEDHDRSISFILLTALAHGRGGEGRGGEGRGGEGITDFWEIAAILHCKH